MTKFCIGLGAASLMLALSSCGAPAKQPKAPELKATINDKLQAQVGLMTYAAALQSFGPPLKCSEAGQTRTCTWAALPDEGPRAILLFKNDRLMDWKLIRKLVSDEKR